jgi:hypothetical protein
MFGATWIAEASQPRQSHGFPNSLKCLFRHRRDRHHRRPQIVEAHLDPGEVLRAPGGLQLSPWRILCRAPKTRPPPLKK